MLPAAAPVAPGASCSEGPRPGKRRAGRGLAGPGAGGAEPGPARAALHAGSRRSAGLGAGRLSIFSEGFIEWIPAVWLHTEILS